jgi:hypothetical protein
MKISDNQCCSFEQIPDNLTIKQVIESHRFENRFDKSDVKARLMKELAFGALYDFVKFHAYDEHSDIFQLMYDHHKHDILCDMSSIEMLDKRGIIDVLIRQDFSFGFATYDMSALKDLFKVGRLNDSDFYYAEDFVIKHLDGLVFSESYFSNLPGMSTFQLRTKFAADDLSCWFYRAAVRHGYHSKKTIRVPNVRGRNFL